ncbi:MAG: DUF4097 family beta strand repeat-containing protein [Clostridiales bacterium]|jgi:DUF4097 and DUF4098 domain-containing protein YvlB|nr:DUF4097 family beta strand repeat-containing protein [Clostridiales bacterium]
MKKIIIICTSAGITLALLGLIFGTHWGIYADATGFHITPKAMTEFTESFTDVRAIDTRLDNSKLIIRQGERFEVSGKYLIEKPDVYVDESGTLILTSFDNISWFNIGFSWHGEITITVPPQSDALLTHLNVLGNNGRIDISDVNVETDLTVNNDNGAITLDNATVGGNVDVRNKNGSISLATIANAKKIRVENNNGMITLSSVQGENIDVKNDNGKITLEMATGKINVDNDNGSIEASLINLMSEYYVMARTQNGSIRVNNYSRGNYAEFGEKDYPYSFKATNNNGSIKLWEVVE